MKKLLVVLALALCHADVFGQGTVLFDTHVPTIVDAPFTFAREPVGSDFGAQLFVSDAVAGTLLPLTPTTTFKTGPAFELFYVNPVVVTVPGKPPGSTVDLEMGIFPLSNPRQYCTGQSIITVVLGGGALPPAYLTGLGRSDVPPDCVPEPSVLPLLMLALGIAGIKLVIMAMSGPNPGHWSECGRATSLADSSASGRPHRSVLSLDHLMLPWIACPPLGCRLPSWRGRFGLSIQGRLIT